MTRSDFAGAFVDGVRFLDDAANDGRGAIVTMHQQVIGTLQVPTGRIVVADPFTTDFSAPELRLALQTPIGAFPVEIAVADNDGDRRIACARVRFLDDVVATTWRPAAFHYDDDEEDEDGGDQHIHDDEEDADGYGVDAGMGCFFDAAARATVDEATRSAWLAACEARQTSSFTHHVVDVGGANVVMFTSGDGDGWYTTYAGYADDGRLVELVTEFDVLSAVTRDRLTLPMPLRGRRTEPFFVKHMIGARTPWWSKHRIVFDEFCQVSVSFDDGTTASSTSGLWSPWEVRWPAKTTKTARTITLAVITGTVPMRRL